MDKGKPAADDSIASRIGCSLFFLVFLVAGIGFSVFIIRESVRIFRQRSWPVVPCVILESEVRETGPRDTPYVPHVVFQYEIYGQTHTGDTVEKGQVGFADQAKANGLARRFPVGRKTVCHVNPRDPSDAFLLRESPLVVLFILIPLVFILIGGGGIRLIWSKKSHSNKPELIAGTSARGNARKQVGTWFFVIFIGVGSGVFYFLTIRPLGKVIAARSWVEVPCRIERAEVRSHRSDDRTTYSVYILYEYEIEGRLYRNDRYEFLGGSSSGWSSKQRVVNRYRSAEAPVCYVNPDDPYDSVLARGLRPTMLIGLFGLLFLLAGVAGLGGAFSHPETSASGNQEAEPYQYAQAQKRTAPDGSVTLEPDMCPKGCLVIALVAAAIWNCVLLLFIKDDIVQIINEGLSWGMLNLAPWVGIGIALLVAVFYFLLASLNPKPVLVLNPGRLPLGGTGLLKWRFEGNATRIGSLKLTLRGVETATYRRGTRNITDKSIFWEDELFFSSLKEDIRRTRQVEFSIPREHAMHTFRSFAYREPRNNTLTWHIELHAHIPLWPDIKQNFEIIVLPEIV